MTQLVAGHGAVMHARAHSKAEQLGARAGAVMPQDIKVAPSSMPTHLRPVGPVLVTLQDSQVGGQLRSGKDYYTKRDKVADQQLMDLEEQEQDTGPVAATEGAAAAAAGIQELPEGAAERTQRLIEANADLPPLDRERMADFAKSRGNEYFKCVVAGKCIGLQQCCMMHACAP